MNLSAASILFPCSKAIAFVFEHTKNKLLQVSNFLVFTDLFDHSSIHYYHLLKGMANMQKLYQTEPLFFQTRQHHSFSKIGDRLFYTALLSSATLLTHS